MDVRTCKSCGKLFNYLSGAPLCPHCLKQLDEKFAQVKEYVYDHPGAGVQEVAEENDVTISMIKKWVREERLMFSEDSAVGIECEKCGRNIRTGRYCDTCKGKITNELGGMYPKPKQKAAAPIKRTSDANAKMRFLK